MSRPFFGNGSGDQVAHLATATQCLGVSMSRIIDQQSILWIRSLFKNEVLNGSFQLLLVWIFQKLDLKTIFLQCPLHLDYVYFDPS